MKASLIALALMLPVGIALAQKEPGSDSSKNGSNAAASSGQSQSSSSTKAEKPGEVNTKKYKGMLVDAACANGTSAASPTTSPSQKAATAKSGEASRSAGTGQSCDATTSTTAFGLRMHDGNVLRFDAVGNERTKQAITARKKWADDAAAGKPIQASAAGMESGDTLTVISIH